MATPAQNVVSDQKRELLRHALATLAYRGGKAVRGVPAGFAEFRAGEGVRTPGEILAHIGDLLDWAVSLVEGNQRWHDSAPLAWDEGVKRFYAGTKALEDALSSGAAVAASPESLFQGPIADALTHIGQIAILRRLAGHPVKGENYFKADIVTGRVGPEQAAPKREF
jgi:hypothetical protein